MFAIVQCCIVINVLFCAKFKVKGRFIISAQENRKIGIFPNGLVHDFGKNVQVFSSFVFMKNRSRKSVC